jgi:predicted phosphoadenosine phosphosulfate sulfurtransferase
MAKIYKNETCMEACLKRYDYIFQEFDNIYLSVSGGKDSSVMLQLADMKAKENNKKYDVLFIDLEAQYQATISHMEELILKCTQINKIYWVCLPLSLRNAVSILQPKWTCWDKKEKNKWVRDMPKNKHVINEKKLQKLNWDWFVSGMEFEEFIIEFAKWYSEKNGLTATGIGIRSDESLNRFTTIISEVKEKYKDIKWTTRVRKNAKPLNCYNFFPLYDFRTEDIWGSIFKYDFIFNEIYEMMFKNGLSIHEQRLCQPYGDDQKNGLDQFKALEYETWEKVLNRVNGVNFGNIYARSSLLGNLTTQKPDKMSWQEYTIFLLESIRLYAPELEQHYYGKIKTAMKWWEEKEDTSLHDIKDAGDLKLESERKIATWRRIARAIERNDFWMKRLSFGATKSDVEKLNKLKEKYSKLVGDGKVDKDMERYQKGELIV